MSATKKTRSPTLRWRREPRERGLAGVVQGELGYQLWLGSERIATVAVYYEFGRHSRKLGYYWVARNDALGVPLRNTADGGRIYATADDAKAACLEYVRECLSAPSRRKCSGCIHDAHIGMCTSRNGGTAYACPCTRSTP